MFHNVVVGKPIVEPKELLALNDIDWETNEKQKHYLPTQDFFRQL